MITIRSVIFYLALDSLKFYYYLSFNIQYIYNSINYVSNRFVVHLVTGNLYLTCVCNGSRMFKGEVQ